MNNNPTYVDNKFKYNGNGHFNNQWSIPTDKPLDPKKNILVRNKKQGRIKIR
jgi:hypothetical protein